MTTTPQRLGLPIWGILFLAALAVPRVIGHDLGWLHEGTFVNLLFAIVPVAIWVAVAVVRRVPSPFVTMLATGAAYGIGLAIAHQLLWDVSWGADPPILGGTVEGRLDPAFEALLLRGAAVLSSLVTGLVTGAIAGVLAWAAALLARRATGSR